MTAAPRPRPIDYYHDPQAPRPNSLVPAVTVVVENTSELEHLPMHPAQRLRLQHYLERRPPPYIG